MTRHSSTLLRLATATAAFLPAIVQAHPGHADASSVAAGILHPLGGVDHLMALAAVGLLAGRMGSWARVAIPAAFLCLAGVGLAIGFAGVQLIFLEAAILASVGACLAMAAVPPRRLPVATCALIGLFALFHGNAHGIEMAAGFSRAGVAAGLLLGSALIIGLTAGLSSAASARGETSR